MQNASAAKTSPAAQLALSGGSGSPTGRHSPVISALTASAQIAALVAATTSLRPSGHSTVNTCGDTASMSAAASSSSPAASALVIGQLLARQPLKRPHVDLGVVAAA